MNPRDVRTGFVRASAMGERRTLKRGTEEYVDVVNDLRARASGGDSKAEGLLRAINAGTGELWLEHFSESGQWTCPAGVTDITVIGKGGDAGTAAGPGAPGYMTIIWVQPKLD